jgi:hypothetical protein
MEKDAGFLTGVFFYIGGVVYLAFTEASHVIEFNPSGGLQL